MALSAHLAPGAVRVSCVITPLANSGGNGMTHGGGGSEREKAKKIQTSA